MKYIKSEETFLINEQIISIRSHYKDIMESYSDDQIEMMINEGFGDWFKKLKFWFFKTRNMRSYQEEIDKLRDQIISNGKDYFDYINNYIESKSKEEESLTFDNTDLKKLAEYEKNYNNSIDQINNNIKELKIKIQNVIDNTKTELKFNKGVDTGLSDKQYLTIERDKLERESMSKYNDLISDILKQQKERFQNNPNISQEDVEKMANAFNIKDLNIEKNFLYEFGKKLKIVEDNFLKTKGGNLKRSIITQKDEDKFNDTSDKFGDATSTVLRNFKLYFHSAKHGKTPKNLLSTQDHFLDQIAKVIYNIYDFNSNLQVQISKAENTEDRINREYKFILAFIGEDVNNDIKEFLKDKHKNSYKNVHEAVKHVISENL